MVYNLDSYTGPFIPRDWNGKNLVLWHGIRRKILKDCRILQHPILTTQGNTQAFDYQIDGKAAGSDVQFSAIINTGPDSLSIVKKIPESFDIFQLRSRIINPVELKKFEGQFIWKFSEDFIEEIYVLRVFLGGSSKYRINYDNGDHRTLSVLFSGDFVTDLTFFFSKPPHRSKIRHSHEAFVGFFPGDRLEYIGPKMTISTCDSRHPSVLENFKVEFFSEESSEKINRAWVSFNHAVTGVRSAMWINLDENSWTVLNR